MKTEVIMKRDLFGYPISQKSKTLFFSATDLVKAGNKWRFLNDLSLFNMSTWLNKESTKEFIAELERKFDEKVISKGRGRGNQTWVHPLLFIDMALSINPKLKVEVYDWMFDHLIKFRNESGDSYKKMCGNLYVRHGHKKTFNKFISNIAIQIQHKCKVIDWQEATEDQLRLRDKIHNDIALLADVLNNNDEAVRLGISKN